MRVIQPKMLSYLMHMNKDNGLYAQARADKDARVLSILHGQACVGKREATGNNDGLFVELAQQTVDGVSAKEAYCMGGVQTLVAAAEELTGKKSPLLPTEHCMTCWRGSPVSMRVARAQIRAGDVVIWNHKGGDSGHTGIIIEPQKDRMIMVEFNTTAGVGASQQIVREGGGVYLTNRPYTQVGDMILIGFLRPFAS